MDSFWEKNKNMDRFVRSALLLGLLALSFSSSFGVNLQLERSVKITSVSEASASLEIGFSWDRSWCDRYNSDAVWVFFKWRTSRGDWSHVYLNSSASTPDGYTSFPGTSGSKTVGFFVYHSEAGLFPSATASLSVTWPFPSGVTKEMLDRGEVDIVAYGVEMVLVPFGSFMAGDGVSTHCFTAPGSSSSVVVSSEDALSVSVSGSGALASSGSVYSTSGGASLSGSGSSLASSDGLYTCGGPISLYGSYPKGFNGFYCMKYELSQGQYTDFLNALSRVDQIRLLGDRVISLQRGAFLFGGGGSASFRNSIRVLEPASASRGVVFVSGVPSATPNTPPASGGGLSASNGSPVACNFLSPSDLFAYASWSGLRPMSELEFEKLCRRSAPLGALAGGFAWDSDSYTPMSGLLDIDTDSERPVSGNVNGGSGVSPVTNSSSHNPLSPSAGSDGLYAPGCYPVRCGAFSSSGTDRFSSGASFSGIMELSGNVREMCVSVGASSFSRSLHGDGSYPLVPFGGSVNYSHIGTRGGGFSSPSERLRVSDRGEMINTFSSSGSRLSDVGFRLVRSVDPSSVRVDAGSIGFGASGASDTAYCSGEAFTISSTGSASVSGIGGIDMNYEWYMDGGRVSGARGASLSFPSGLVNVPSSSDRRYSFTRRVVTALGSSDSDPVAIHIYPAFSSGAIESGGDTVCSGMTPTKTIGSLESAAGGSGMVVYQWYQDGLTIAGATGVIYKPSSPLSASVTFTRMARDGKSGLPFRASAGSWTVKVIESPSGRISGGGTVCPGSSARVSLSFSGGLAPYYYTVTGLEESVSSGVSASLDLSVGGTYSLTALRDQTGCAGTSLTGSATITNQIVTVLAGSIVGSTSAACGCVEILSGTVASTNCGSFSYSWKRGATSLGDKGGGIKESGLAPGTYTYYRTATNGSVSSTCSLSVTVKSCAPPNTINVNGKYWSNYDVCTSCTWEQAMDKCASLGMRLPNNSDWNALPGNYISKNINYWSATEVDSRKAYTWSWNGSNWTYSPSNNKSLRFSVRCVK